MPRLVHFQDHVTPPGSTNSRLWTRSCLLIHRPRAFCSRWPPSPELPQPPQSNSPDLHLVLLSWMSQRWLLSPPFLASQGQHLILVYLRRGEMTGHPRSSTDSISNGEVGGTEVRSWSLRDPRQRASLYAFMFYSTIPSSCLPTSGPSGALKTGGAAGESGMS